MTTATRVDLAALERDLCLTHLPTFIECAWPLVEPVVDLVWNWHLDELCSALGDVTAGRIKRLIVNVPPGTSKSLVVSVFWPAFEWASNPSLRYFAVSYGQRFSNRDNIRLRTIVTSPWYRALVPDFRLSGDQSAKERFDTTARGWRIATSVGGVGTGEHPDRIIIDDPHTAEQASSDAERQQALDWFDRTLSTRGITRDVRTVLIMQRLHEEDLTGHLLERGGWEHIRFPMRFEPAVIDEESGETVTEADPRDHRTTPGELLWPELFPEERVAQLEVDLDPYGAAAQLQQRPSPEGGGLFKRGWFNIVDAIPAGARNFTRGWDTAGTEGGGDWTVGVKMAEHEGVVYVVDVVRDQVGPGGVDRLIHATAQLDGRHCAQREEQEPGASGVAVIQARAKLLKGYDYGGVSVTGDKVTRARPYRAQCEVGNVALVRGEWNSAYIAQLCAFPAGKHDDMVDGSSCAYNQLALGPRRPTRATWGNRNRNRQRRTG